MSEVAQHDRHDQLSTTSLMGTELIYWGLVPMVSGHYAMGST